MGSAGRPLILPDVAHELRLQPLRAQFAADVQSPFLHGDFVIPGTKVEHWAVKFYEGCPHQPPAVSGSLERAEIRPGTAIEQIWSGRR